MRVKKNPTAKGRPKQTLPGNKAHGIVSFQILSFSALPNHIQGIKFSQKSPSEVKAENQLVESPRNLPSYFSQELKGQLEGEEWNKKTGRINDSESPTSMFNGNKYWTNLPIQFDWFCHILKNYSFTFSYLNWKSSQIHGINHRDIIWSFHPPQALELEVEWCRLLFSYWRVGLELTVDFLFVFLLWMY